MLAIEGQEFGDCDALRFRITVLDSQYQMERSIHLADVAILLALAAQQLDPASLNPRDDLAPLVRTPRMSATMQKMTAGTRSRLSPRTATKRRLRSSHRNTAIATLTAATRPETMAAMNAADSSGKRGRAGSASSPIVALRTNAHTT